MKQDIETIARELWDSAFRAYGNDWQNSGLDQDAAVAIIQTELAKTTQYRNRMLLDHGRMLWRDDVSGHCQSPDMCFEYTDTVRCGPCAISQSRAEGIEPLNQDHSYLPEVCRLKREYDDLLEKYQNIVNRNV